MKLFSFRNRPDQNAGQIPHTRVEAAHLTGPGKLRVQAEHLLYQSEQARQIRIDAQGLREIVCYGEVVLTGAAMQLVHDSGIDVSWLSADGRRVLGRLAQDSSARTLTRLLQFQAWNDRTWQLITARRILGEKLESIRAALRHYQRQGKPADRRINDLINGSLDALPGARTVDELRGIEGNAAAAWYRAYGEYFSLPWVFRQRSRRPPLDRVNALLSLGYMQLYRRVAARIEAYGYEASLGALHEFRPGRLSMACDLMEPLRIPVVDRLVLALCRQRMIPPDAFRTSAETGEVSLTVENLAGFLRRFEEHWHQGMYRQVLEESLRRWSEGIREQVSTGTSRAAAYLKSRALAEIRRSGGAEADAG